MRIVAALNTLLQSILPYRRHTARMRRCRDEDLYAHVLPKQFGGHTFLLPYRTGVVRDCILAIKYEKDARSIRIAAHILRQFLFNLRARTYTDYLLCAVPASSVRRSREQYHHLHAVLNAVRDAGYPDGMRDARDVLRWQRAAERQSRMPDAHARKKNVAGALHASPVVGCSVIVIDDVVTSGATLNEARRALRAAGAGVILTVALAH